MTPVAMQLDCFESGWGDPAAFFVYTPLLAGLSRLLLGGRTCTMLREAGVATHVPHTVCADHSALEGGGDGDGTLAGADVDIGAPSNEQSLARSGILCWERRYFIGSGDGSTARAGGEWPVSLFPRRWRWDARRGRCGHRRSQQ